MALENAPVPVDAGTSAQRRYDELVRSWRRRNRKLFVIVAVICAVIGVSSFVAARQWPGYSWFSGVVGGAALAFWVVARVSPPGWIENWQSGVYGEQATAKVLRRLEKEGWVVLHDLQARRGNVDHIVVGPGGVFVLDSKRLAGEVSVDEGRLTVRRLDDPDLTYRSESGGRYLLSLARQTHQRVLERTRIKIWVAPVMVLWSDFQQRVVEERCAYVHGDELVEWLRARPRTISPTRVAQIADAVRAAWEPGPDVTRISPQLTTDASNEQNIAS